MERITGKKRRGPTLGGEAQFMRDAEQFHKDAGHDKLRLNVDDNEVMQCTA